MRVTWPGALRVYICKPACLSDSAAPLCSPPPPLSGAGTTFSGGHRGGFGIPEEEEFAVRCTRAAARVRAQQPHADTPPLPHRFCPRMWTWTRPSARPGAATAAAAPLCARPSPRWGPTAVRCVSYLGLCSRSDLSRYALSPPARAQAASRPSARMSTTRCRCRCLMRMRRVARLRRASLRRRYVRVLRCVPPSMLIPWYAQRARTGAKQKHGGILKTGGKVDTSIGTHT